MHSLQRMCQYLLFLLFCLVTSNSGQKILTCPGAIYFKVLTNFERNDREYFYHTQATSVDECVKKCYGNEFCFSAGFQPLANGSNVCLFSYHSAYGCSRERLMTTYADNSQDVVVECLRCPSAGELIMCDNSTETGDATTCNLLSATAAPVEEETIPPPTEASNLDASPIVVGDREECSKLLTFNIRVPDVSKKPTDFSKFVLVKTVAECAKVCFSAKACTGAGYAPLIDEPGGACILETDSHPCAKEVKNFAQYESDSPVLIDCIRCGAVTKADQQQLQRVCDKQLSFHTAPPDKEISYASNRNVANASECAQLCFASSDCEIAGFLPGSEEEGNECFLSQGVPHQECSSNATSVSQYSGTEPITLRCITCGPPVGEEIEEPVQVKPVTAVETKPKTRPLCNQTIGFMAIPPPAKKLTTYVDQVDVETALECAQLCYERADCTVASYLPATEGSDDDENICILTSNETESICNMPRRINTYSRFTPVNLVCISCVSETALVLEEAPSAKEVETKIPACGTQLFFGVSSAPPNSKQLNFGAQVSVNSVSECASFCYRYGNCTRAAYDPTEGACITIHDAAATNNATKNVTIEECSPGKTKYTSYQATEPVVLDCIHCKGEAEQIIDAASLSKLGNNATTPGCAGALSFVVSSPKVKQTDFTDMTTVDTPLQCAKYCFENNCHHAGFEPLSGACLLSNVSDTNDEESCSSQPPVFVYSTGTPVLISCISCNASASPVLDVAPVSKLVQESAKASSNKTARPVTCKFIVNVASIAEKDQLKVEDQLFADNAQECAKQCHDNTKCHRAGFEPESNACLILSSAAANVSCNSSKQTSSYDGSASIYLDCIVCEAGGLATANESVDAARKNAPDAEELEPTSSEEEESEEQLGNHAQLNALNPSLSQQNKTGTARNVSESLDVSHKNSTAAEVAMPTSSEESEEEEDLGVIKRPGASNVSESVDLSHKNATSEDEMPTSSEESDEEKQIGIIKAPVSANQNGSSSSGGCNGQLLFVARPGTSLANFTVSFGQSIKESSAVACAQRCFSIPNCHGVGYDPAAGICLPMENYNRDCAAGEQRVSAHTASAAFVMDCFVCNSNSSHVAGAVSGAVENDTVVMKSGLLSAPHPGNASSSIGNSSNAALNESSAVIKPGDNNATKQDAGDLTVPQCHGAIQFTVRPASSDEKFIYGFTTEIPATSAQQCAEICHRMSCHIAGFEPTGQFCLVAENVTSGAGLSDCGPQKTRVSSFSATIPVVIECVQCSGSNASADLEAQPNQKSLVGDMVLPVKSQDEHPATTGNNTRCTGNNTVYFQVVAASQLSNTDVITSMSALSAQACANFCFAHGAECSYAVFVPQGSTGQCVLHSQHKECIKDTVSVTTYAASVPTLIICVHCSETAVTGIGAVVPPSGALPTRGTPKCSAPLTFEVQPAEEQLDESTTAAVGKSVRVNSASECAQHCFESAEECFAAYFIPQRIPTASTSCFLITEPSRNASCNNQKRSSFNTSENVIVQCINCPGTVSMVSGTITGGSTHEGKSPGPTEGEEDHLEPQKLTNATAAPPASNATGIMGSTLKLVNATTRPPIGGARPLCPNDLVQFQVSLAPIDKELLSFDAAHLAASTAECAQKCYADGGCQMAGFLPPLPSQPAGTCFFTSNKTVCNKEQLSISSFEANEAVILHCLSCGQHRKSRREARQDCALNYKLEPYNGSFDAKLPLKRTLTSSVRQCADLCYKHLSCSRAAFLPSNDGIISSSHGMCVFLETSKTSSGFMEPSSCQNNMESGSGSTLNAQELSLRVRPVAISCMRCM